MSKSPKKLNPNIHYFDVIQGADKNVYITEYNHLHDYDGDTESDRYFTQRERQQFMFNELTVKVVVDSTTYYIMNLAYLTSVQINGLVKKIHNKQTRKVFFND